MELVLGERKARCFEKRKKCRRIEVSLPFFERCSWLFWDSMGLVHGVGSLFAPLGQLLLAGMDSSLFSPKLY